jgi:hypothetical protein
MLCRTEKREASSWSGCIRDETAFAVCSSTLDKKPEHSLALLHFACGLIAFRTSGLCG